MLETTFLILGAIISSFLQVFIHEIGHLIFGIATGYKFLSFRIFNLVFYKHNQKIYIGKHCLLGTGGQCILTPGFQESENIPYFFYNAGGFIANFFTAVIAGRIVFMFPEESIFRTVITFFFIIGLIFTIVNGFPFKGRLIGNDGYNILKMIHNSQAKRAFWRQYKFNELLSNGTKLNDCPREWFSNLNEDYSNPLICGWAIYVLFYHLEKQDYEEALKLCNKIIDTKGVMGLYKNEAICEKQFSEIMISLKSGEKEVKYIRTKNIFKERIVTIAGFHNIYAYRVLVLGHYEEAVGILNAFEKKALTYSNKGLVDLERNILYSLKTMIT